MRFLLELRKGFHQTKKVFIAVWPLSGFCKKCVDEKMGVERSQSRTGNSIVHRILHVSLKIKPLLISSTFSLSLFQQSLCHFL